MPDGCNSFDTYLQSIIKKLMNDLTEYYNLDSSVFDSISDAFISTNESFIFVLDEL